ncbi:anti-sigma factor RsbA family regulatory protein [Streptomyces doebereineriae]|uniref:Anti-sigma factor RsbA family regulatory protein n=1 Tax=Streptomyces doebereineriae TaxID=3075528 RepID=A0ABU2VE55_9ACTN|nr:anti-sigma factor RsbA family regulatory protein [Streptomyces sp. DSM 41640]MDT0483535.1 anti-sigma factor RsbA family regulatory protein [Streptomyces sp. DSM 41640]
MNAVAETAGPFMHPALFYRDEREYLAGVVPFVRKALAAGEPVAVAVPTENLRLLKAEIGAGEAVRFLDMREAGRNPGRIIPGVLRAFADAQPPGTRVRIVGEPIWAGRTATEYPACVQHEALINAAFQGRPVTILCPYDTRRLDPQAVADAYATHPVVVDAGSGREEESGRYDFEAVHARYNAPLPPAPDVPAHAFVADVLGEIRHFASEAAARLGLLRPRLDDLALAVAELTTNSVVHGGGSGLLRVWAEDGHVVCEVRDRGHLTDLLAGRRPPSRDQHGGRGLLIVNLVADLVRVHTGPEGSTVRFWFAL